MNYLLNTVVVKIFSLPTVVVLTVYWYCFILYTVYFYIRTVLKLRILHIAAVAGIAAVTATDEIGINNLCRGRRGHDQLVTVRSLDHCMQQGVDTVRLEPRRSVNSPSLNSPAMLFDPMHSCHLAVLPFCSVGEGGSTCFACRVLVYQTHACIFLQQSKFSLVVLQHICQTDLWARTFSIDSYLFPSTLDVILEHTRYFGALCTVQYRIIILMNIFVD